jgi:hypothetical protein
MIWSHAAILSPFFGRVIDQIKKMRPKKESDPVESSDSASSDSDLEELEGVVCSFISSFFVFG